MEFSSPLLYFATIVLTTFVIFSLRLGSSHDDTQRSTERRKPKCDDKESRCLVTTTRRSKSEKGKNQSFYENCKDDDGWKVAQ